jgi:hypothetical protein
MCVVARRVARKTRLVSKLSRRGYARATGFPSQEILASAADLGPRLRIDQGYNTPPAKGGPHSLGFSPEAEQNRR